MSVEPGGPAAEAGIQKGMVIHQIGRAEIRTADDLARVAKTLKSGDEVGVQVETQRGINFVTITIE